jgi:hypothetical protein
MATKTSSKEILEAKSDQNQSEQVTVEDVERRAYEIYLERGGEFGGDLDDWLQAERELGSQKA